MVLNSILTKSQLSIQNISLGQWRAWRQRAQLSWAGVVRVAPASASAAGFPAFLPFFFTLFFQLSFFHRFQRPSLGSFCVTGRKRSGSGNKASTSSCFANSGEQGLGLLLSNRQPISLHFRKKDSSLLVVFACWNIVQQGLQSSVIEVYLFPLF